MTPQPELDIAVQRRRLMVMVGVVAVCALLAAGAIVGDLVFHVGWLIWLFVAAVLTGFAAQIWLVVGLAGRRR